MEKSLNERTLDRLMSGIDEIIANVGNEEYWIKKHGGPEKYADHMAMVQRAVESQERHNREVQTPEQIAEWAHNLVASTKDHDVEQWGRDIAIGAQEETMRLEEEERKRALDSTK